MRHCHPGAGYLHLLMYLHTHRDCLNDLGQDNRFVAGGYSRDFTNASSAAVTFSGCWSGTRRKLNLAIALEGMIDLAPSP